MLSKLKATLSSKIEINEKVELGKMYFRHFEPTKDEIIKHYAPHEWIKILGSTSEEDLIDLNQCVNVVIYLWCETSSEYPQGMLYLEENFKIPGEISFHGGTWNHNPRFYLLIFESLIKLFSKLLDLGYTITTSCGYDNLIADKLQKALGFIEVGSDEFKKIKRLDSRQFVNSPLYKRFQN